MTEQKRAADWLTKALEFETKGRDFYLKVSQSVTDKAASDLFKTLADLEFVHMEDIKKIYSKLDQGESCWISHADNHNAQQALNKIFADLAKATEGKAPQSLVESIETAMGFEADAADFYEKESANAQCAPEKKFLLSLAAEEREHHKILADMKLFYTDPEAWAEQVAGGHLDGA